MIIFEAGPFAEHVCPTRLRNTVAEHGPRLTNAEMVSEGTARIVPGGPLHRRTDLWFDHIAGRHPPTEATASFGRSGPARAAVDRRPEKPAAR